MILRDIAAIPAAYAIGCVVTGYYLVRAWRQQDIRTLHSGSTGARNVGRVLGAPGFAITLAFDALKAAAVMLAARAVGVTDAVLAWLPVAVTAGHIWPAQLRFRGGRGIAPTLGAVPFFPFHAWGLNATIAIGTLAALILVTHSAYLRHGRFMWQAESGGDGGAPGSTS